MEIYPALCYTDPAFPNCKLLTVAELPEGPGVYVNACPSSPCGDVWPEWEPGSGVPAAVRVLAAPERALGEDSGTLPLLSSVFPLPSFPFITVSCSQEHSPRLSPRGVPGPRKKEPD